MEDPSWTARMDAGWETEKMRAIATSALERAGTEAAHFRPAAEMNAHKLTLGVREAAVPATVAFITEAVAAAGLRAKVIASGTGGWQYVDVVAAGAGKLESLEYVRAALRFSRAATVAAGDSGNDVAMLSGRHRAIVVGNAQPDLAAWAAAQCGEGALALLLDLRGVTGASTQGSRQSRLADARAEEVEVPDELIRRRDCDRPCVALRLSLRAADQSRGASQQRVLNGNRGNAPWTSLPV